MFRIIILFIFSSIYSIECISQQLLRHFWQPNGTVQRIFDDTASNQLIITGNFTHLGPYNPGIAWADSLGNPFLHAPNADLDTNIIKITIPDNNGGWLIGGTFTTFGDSLRNAFAHVDSNFSVTGIKLNIGPNSDIYSLAISGDTLFVSGNLHYTNGTNGSFAAFSLPTGNPILFWNLYSPPQKILVEADTVWIGGGAFLPNLSIRGIAKLNKNGGFYTTWNTYMNGSVYDFEFYQDKIILCGSFYFNGSWKNITSINRYTATETPGWSISASSIGCIEIKDSLLFLGGSFTQLNGVQRNRLASFNLVSNTLTSWNPNVNGAVSALTITNANKILIGGNFNSVAGGPRFGFAEFDYTNSPTLTQNTIIIEGNVSFISENANGVRGFAGTFSSLGGIERGNFAAIDIASGLPTPLTFNLVSPSLVHGITSVNDLLYMVGRFIVLDSAGNPRKNAIAIDPITGLIQPWDPQIATTMPGNRLGILPYSGDLIISGMISSINNVNGEIYRIDQQGNIVTTYGINPITYMPTILLEDSILYFTNVYGGLISLNVIQEDSIHETIHVNEEYWDIAKIGDTLLLCGDFAMVNNLFRPMILAYDLLQKSVINWTSTSGSQVNGSPTINHLVALDVDEKFIYTISNLGYYNTMAIDSVSNPPPYFLPIFDGNNFELYRDILVSRGNIYIGGDETHLKSPEFATKKGLWAWCKAMTGSPSFSSSSITVCEGDQNIPVTSTPVANAGNYNWSYSGTGLTITGTGNQALISVSYGATSGTLTLSVVNSCSPPVTATINITVLNQTAATMSVNTDTLCSSGVPVTVSVNPPGGTLTGTGVVGNQFNPTIAGTGLHTLSYTVLNSNGCQSTGYLPLTVINCQGTHDFSALEMLELAPNPGQAAFKISGFQTEMSVSIRNSIGQSVGFQRTSSAEGLIINLSDNIPGVYFVTITSGTKWKTLKWIAF